MVVFLTAAPEGQAIVTKIEARVVLGIAGLTGKCGIEITVRMDFVGGQLPVHSTKARNCERREKPMAHSFNELPRPGNAAFT